MSLRVLVVTLLCGLLLGGQSGEPVRAVTAPSVSVRAVSSTAVEVRWRPTGTDPHRWWVILTDGDDRSVGQRTACGACRSVVVRHLAPGSAYNVRVVGLDADGTFGEFTPIASARTETERACRPAASGETCVLVGVRPGEGAPGVGLGFLHSFSDGTDPARIEPLHPTAWRIAANDVARFAVARRYGGEITVILSDPWMQGPTGPAPWNDWAFYRWWIGIVVDAHIANGMVPDHWEVQNEPAEGSYSGAMPATAELLWEQHRVAAEAIHDRLPGASVIGPAAGYPNFGFGLADAEAFLDRAAATPGTIDGLSWHEIGAGCLGYCDGSPRAVLQHADDARAALARRGLGGLELHVNEWGAPWNIRQPGAIVGYLSSITYAGIDVANTTCWHHSEPISDQRSCTGTPGNLTGLLLDDGTTPTDAWWAHKGFADMTGAGFRLLGSSVADPSSSAVATVDPQGVVRLAIGRHTGCDVDVDAHCPGSQYGASRTVRPFVAVPRRSGSYRVSVTQVRSSAGAVTDAPAATERVVRARDGMLDAGAVQLPDGDALFLTITPV